jgi:hypothetical protein
MEIISRYAHCDPALAQRLRRRVSQQRWRAKRREKRMEFWSRMGRLVYAIGDRETARLLRVRAQNLARNRLMKDLGYYNFENARAAKAAKRAEAPRRRGSRSGRIRSRGTPARYGREKRQGIGPCSLP